MDIIVLYCVFCYLFMLGFFIEYNEITKNEKFISILISPILTPFMLGIVFYEMWDSIDNIDNDSKRII